MSDMSRDEFNCRANPPIKAQNNSPLIQKKNSARRILTASGVFDLLNLFSAFAVVILLIVFAAMLSNSVEAAGGGIKDGAVNGLSGLVVGVFGGISVVVVAVFAAFCVIPTICWLISTIISFKASTAPIAAAKRKIGGLITFSVFQYLAGLAFIVAGMTLKIGTDNDNRLTMIIGIVLGISMLLCATLKAIAVSKIKKQQLPQINQSNFQNNQYFSGQQNYTQQNFDQPYNFQQYDNPQINNPQNYTQQNFDQPYNFKQYNNPQINNPQINNPQNYTQNGDDINQ